MWVSVQCTTTCEACGKATPVNAAVDQVVCDGCGAELGLADSLWAGALVELAEQLEDLPPNGKTSSTFTQAGGTLRIQAERRPPTCPHCEEPWPAERPGDPWFCPACGQDAAVRATHGAVLVAEDRALLAGTTGGDVTETIACASCASPLLVDGSARHLVCGSCGSDNVLADEVWRRVHAPGAVARWYVWLDGEGAAEGWGDLGQINALATDGERLYCTASHGDTDFALLALNTSPPSLAWMCDLAEHGAEEWGIVSLAPDGSLLWFSPHGADIHRFAAADGRHRGKITLDAELHDVVGDVDGTLVICQSPSIFSELSRLGRQAQPQPIWPPQGFMRRMFGGGPGDDGLPCDRQVRFMPGRIGMGLDHELRVIAAAHVARYQRDGTMRWSRKVPGVSVSIHAPAASPDGTTWASFMGETGGSVLVRVDPDGANPKVVVDEGEEGVLGPVAAAPDGSVWVATADREVRHHDRDGALLWRWRRT